MSSIRKYPQKCPVCGSKRIKANPEYGMKCLRCNYVNLRNVKIKEG